MKLSEAKVGDTVHFKCGGKCKITHKAFSLYYPGCYYLKFDGSKKFGCNFNNSGKLFTASTCKPVDSFITIVKITKGKKK